MFYHFSHFFYGTYAIRVYLHTAIVSMSRKSLLETGEICGSDCNVTRTYKHLVGKLTLNHQRVIVYELSGCWFQSGFSQKTNETN